MRAAVITSLAGPGAVRVRDLPRPTNAPDRVVVDVHYAALVFPDVLQTRGEYQLRPELPFVPGWEVSGVVREDSSGFRAGTRVAAMPVVGGLAEVVSVDPGMVFRLPDTVPLDVGSAMPLNYLTAHFALHTRARLRAEEWVLVHGAGGGLGAAACQLAAVHGARVLAVVSSDDKARVARAAGAHETVPVEGFLETVRERTDGAGVDVVVDPVGGDRFTDSVRSLSPGGRLLVLGFTGGGIPTVGVDRLLASNVTVMGAASNEHWQTVPGGAAQQWHALLPHVRAGRIAPTISATRPLEDVASALGELEERRAAGRVLIRMPVASRKNPGSGC